MRHLIIICIGLLLLITIFISNSQAWLIFHKPKYQGKIIDADTKKPLEGVVVVAIYRTSDVFGGPCGPASREIHAQEVLTNADGLFVIPSYTTIMNPIARAERAYFRFFKPGYRSTVETIGVQCWKEKSTYYPSQCHLETIFSKEIGNTEEIQIIKHPSPTDRTVETVEITYGIVEMAKVKTWAERERNVGISVPFDSDLPILEKMEDEEVCLLSFHRCEEKKLTIKFTKYDCKDKFNECKRHRAWERSRDYPTLREIESNLNTNPYPTEFKQETIPTIEWPAPPPAEHTPIEVMQSYRKNDSSVKTGQKKLRKNLIRAEE